MAAGALVEDAQSDLVAAAHRDIPGGRECQFALPLANADEEDTPRERGRACQIAFLVGDGPAFRGVAPDTWASDQVLIRGGGRSRSFLSHPPPLPAPGDPPRRPHGPRGRGAGR